MLRCLIEDAKRVLQRAALATRFCLRLGYAWRTAWAKAER